MVSSCEQLLLSILAVSFVPAFVYVKGALADGRLRNFQLVRKRSNDIKLWLNGWPARMGRTPITIRDGRLAAESPPLTLLKTIPTPHKLLPTNIIIYNDFLRLCLLAPKPRPVWSRGLSTTQALLNSCVSPTLLSATDTSVISFGG